MQKGAKCISELSWRYYKEWVEEISVRCHGYMVYISLFKNTNNSWGLHFFRNLDNFNFMTYLTFHAVVKSGFRSSRVHVTSINSKIKRSHIKNKQSYRLKLGFSLRLSLFHFIQIYSSHYTNTQIYISHVIVILMIDTPCSKLSEIKRLSLKFSLL